MYKTLEQIWTKWETKHFVNRVQGNSFWKWKKTNSQTSPSIWRLNCFLTYWPMAAIKSPIHAVLKQEQRLLGAYNSKHVFHISQENGLFRQACQVTEGNEAQLGGTYAGHRPSFTAVPWRCSFLQSFLPYRNRSLCELPESSVSGIWGYLHNNGHLSPGYARMVRKEVWEWVLEESWHCKGWEYTEKGFVDFW